MKPAAMKSLSGEAHCHECAPKDWRDVPDMSGDYDLDATIAHRDNPSLPDRLSLYLKRKAYGPRTGYNGYHGYSGDD
jgi:hypothetical protein